MTRTSRPVFLKRAFGFGHLLLGVVGFMFVSTGVRQAGAAPPESAVELLRANQIVFRSVADRLAPYVVRISTVGGSQPSQRATTGNTPAPQDQPDSPFRDTLGSRFIVADGSTTGIVYTSDGYIVTSSFSFVREPQLISVTLADGRRLVARLVARDQVRKIALLKIDAQNLSMPPWAVEEDTRVGQWAIALGAGAARTADKSDSSVRGSLSVGIISALHRMGDTAIQTDAKISPANYGGPLADIHGRILGICVPMAQRPGELAGVELYDSGVGFAIGKSRLDEIVAVLKTGESVYRGWLGINVDARSTDKSGGSDALVILNIADPSPLRSAGVLPGDKIISAAGKETLNFGHLVQAIYMIPAGQTVRLTLQRGSKRFSVEVTLKRGAELGPLPDIPPPPQ